MQSQVSKSETSRTVGWNGSKAFERGHAIVVKTRRAAGLRTLRHTKPGAQWQEDKVKDQGGRMAPSEFERDERRTKHLDSLRRHHGQAGPKESSTQNAVKSPSGTKPRMTNLGTGI